MRNKCVSFLISSLTLHTFLIKLESNTSFIVSAVEDTYINNNHTVRSTQYGIYMRFRTPYYSGPSAQSPNHIHLHSLLAI